MRVLKFTVASAAAVLVGHVTFAEADVVDPVPTPTPTPTASPTPTPTPSPSPTPTPTPTPTSPGIDPVTGLPIPPGEVVNGNIVYVITVTTTTTTVSAPITVVAAPITTTTNSTSAANTTASTTNSSTNAGGGTPTATVQTGQSGKRGRLTVDLKGCAVPARRTKSAKGMSTKPATRRRSADRSAQVRLPRETTLVVRVNGKRVGTLQLDGGRSANAKPLPLRLRLREDGTLTVRRPSGRVLVTQGCSAD
jgi:hypothetical protein